MYLHGHKLNDKAKYFDINWYKSVFKEIWIDHEYSRYGVNVEKNDIVVDCGANVGYFTNYALNYRKAKHVYSFECHESYVECLTENTDENVTITQAFVSDRDEDGHYNVERMLKEFNLTHIDFMKVDIEWWEYPFILNMSDETMKRVNKWVIEVHSIYDNYDKILNMIEKFTLNGFDVNYEQIHKNTNLALLYAKKRI